MRLSSIYYYDKSYLKLEEKTLFEASTGAATYSLQEFKKELIAWLSRTDNFGTSVVPGTKAVFINGSGNRRDCDVLVAAEFRRYTAYTTTSNSYHEGICFFLPDGTRLENFPKQHLANCTAKQKVTNNWFKPTVRVFKNMRNRMIAKGALKEGLAPSYFLEGMLSNVPADKFGSTYQETFVNCFNWVVNTDQAKLTTASGLHWLVRDNVRTSWPSANFKAYTDAASKFWTNW